MLDLQTFLAELAEQRPLFHSEADFQHAFAWQLHQKFPSAWIRLEYPFQVDKWMYIDIWSKLNDEHMAIELKYKTAKLDMYYQTESYHLKNQGAQDTGRYDFLKDVQRLEQIIQRSPNTIGYAILLTNDVGYWNQGRANTVDSEFRLHESREISGSLRWDARASSGTTLGRTSQLDFRKRYLMNWHAYSSPLSERNGVFRYVALQITREATIEE